MANDNFMMPFTVNMGEAEVECILGKSGQRSCITLLSCVFEQVECSELVAVLKIKFKNDGGFQTITRLPAFKKDQKDKIFVILARNQMMHLRAVSASISTIRIFINGREIKVSTFEALKKIENA